MRQLLEIAEDARRAKYTVAKLGTNDKNRALLAIADALEARADEIIAANAADIENGRAAGLNDGLIDRLMLDKKRIAGIAKGCRQVAALPDPVGEVLWMEAINHAKAAGVEIIVAVNKIDKPNANIEKVKQELTEYELIAEDWGGSTTFVPVSAHTKEGIDELLEMILLTAEVNELKANPNRKARGIVIEAELDIL